MLVIDWFFQRPESKKMIYRKMLISLSIVTLVFYYEAYMLDILTYKRQDQRYGFTK